MKQITGAVALALGLSALTVSASDADPAAQPSAGAAVASAAQGQAKGKGKKCATRREFRRIKAKGKFRHRSSVRKVRRIMDFNGKRKSLVHSGGDRWETRKYRHCRSTRPYKIDDFVYVNYKNNRAYAKNGKP